MPQFGSISVFQRVTADALNQIIPNKVVKASTTSITSNTTLATDSELASVALAVGTWEVKLMVWATGVSGGDIKIGWNFATGSLTGTPNRSVLGPNVALAATPDAATPITMSAIAYSTAQIYGLNSTSAFHLIQEEASAFIVATAGTLNIQFAQGTSTGTATVIQAGSYLQVRRTA